MRSAVATLVIIPYLLVPHVAKADVVPSETATAGPSADEVRAQIDLYSRAGVEAYTRYGAFAANPTAELRTEACAWYAIAIAEGKSLHDLLGRSSFDVAKLRVQLQPTDENVANTGQRLARAGGCKGGAVNLSGVGPSYFNRAPPPAATGADLSRGPGLGPSGSKHRVLPLYLTWQDKDGQFSYWLRDGNGRHVEIRASLYGDYLSAVTARTPPTIIGAPAPETAAARIDMVLDYLSTTPDAVKTTFLPLFTVAETRLIVDEILSTAALDAGVAKALHSALRTAEASRTVEFQSARLGADFDTLDRERSTNSWLNRYKVSTAPPESYEQLLKGQQIDLQFERNGRNMLLQIRPTMRIRSLDADHLQIGNHEFKTDELRSMMVAN